MGQPDDPSAGVAMELTSNDMCSFPHLISSSWRPSLFFSGHLESSSLASLSKHRLALGILAYFIISLSLIMRLISASSSELTHTIEMSATDAGGLW